MSPAAEPGADRRAELDQAYRSYTGSYAERWADSNPGNRELLAERERTAREVLAGRARPEVVLDLGAGSAGSFPGLLPDSFAVEAELLFWRLHAGREDRPGVAAVCADGCAVPLRSGTVDLAVLSTVLSSVDVPTADRIAAEVRRVLRPGGALLVYDFRVRNPGNRNTRPVGRRELRRLLPGWGLEVRSLTLAPPLARRLGGRAPTTYPLLARLPFLRTHLVVLATPPAGAPRR